MWHLLLPSVGTALTQYMYIHAGKHIHKVRFKGEKFTKENTCCRSYHWQTMKQFIKLWIWFKLWLLQKGEKKQGCACALMLSPWWRSLQIENHQSLRNLIVLQQKSLIRDGMTSKKDLSTITPSWSWASLLGSHKSASKAIKKKKRQEPNVVGCACNLSMRFGKLGKQNQTCTLKTELQIAAQ